MSAEEAEKMAKLLYMAAAIPFGLALLAGRTDMPFLAWLADLLPWWGWLIVTLFVAIVELVIAIGSYAYRLDEERVALSDRRRRMD